MAIADVEFECRHCGDLIAADRWAELCPGCAQLELTDHCGTCRCSTCQDDGEHAPRLGYGDLGYHGPAGY